MFRVDFFCLSLKTHFITQHLFSLLPLLELQKGPQSQGPTPAEFHLKPTAFFPLKVALAIRSHRAAVSEM